MSNGLSYINDRTRLTSLTSAAGQSAQAFIEIPLQGEEPDQALGIGLPLPPQVLYHPEQFLHGSGFPGSGRSAAGSRSAVYGPAPLMSSPGSRCVLYPAVPYPGCSLIRVVFPGTVGEDGCNAGALKFRLIPFSTSSLPNDFEDFSIVIIRRSVYL